MADEETLRAMLPMGFGKAPGMASRTTKSHNRSEAQTTALAQEQEKEDAFADDDEFEDDDDDDDDDEARPAPSAEAATAEKVGVEPPEVPISPEKETAEEEEQAWAHLREYAGLPLSASIQLAEHTKAVTALSIDRSGARVATGSHDYDVKLWDFGGMTSDLRPFTSFEAAENYPVAELAFAPFTKHLLCLCATTQPRLYDYDGHELCVFNKGDVFMRDMRHTTGHISDMTCGGWNPQDDTMFITGGSDSTVRIWDVGQKTKQKSVIVVRSKDRGTKTKVTATTYTPDARSIVAAGHDGALYVWSTSGNYARPSATVLQAHAHGQSATSLAVAPDGWTLLSRGADDTVKVWDLRQLRTPVVQRDGLPNGSDKTDVLLSPDGQHILTGVAAVPEGSSSLHDPHSRWGQLAVLDVHTLSTTYMHTVSESSVIRLAWHPRINQVFASTRAGAVHVYYDRHASQRGAMLALAKRARSRANPYTADPSEIDPYADVPIMIPEEEEDWIDPVHKKRQFPKNPRNVRVPERPLEGRGKGGRIGRSALQPLMEELWEGDLRSEDPREYVYDTLTHLQSPTQVRRQGRKGSPIHVGVCQDTAQDDICRGRRSFGFVVRNDARCQRHSPGTTCGSATNPTYGAQMPCIGSANVHGLWDGRRSFPRTWHLATAFAG